MAGRAEKPKRFVPGGGFWRSASFYKRPDQSLMKRFGLARRKIPGPDFLTGRREALRSISPAGSASPRWQRFLTAIQVAQNEALLSQQPPFSKGHSPTCPRPRGSASIA